MKTQLVLTILAILVLGTPAQSEGSRYCGRILSETLVKYCQAGAMGKRSESWMRSQIFGAGYWLTPQRAMAMARGKRQQGIATQCCENTCSFSELLAYCPQD